MNRTVLVTGASRGIGLETCNRLASKGYTVIGVARNEPTGSFPGVFLICDLSNIKKTAEIISVIGEAHKIDAIVNCVGEASYEPLEKVGLETLLSIYDLNVRVAVQMTQAFVPSMKARHFGRIINLASRAIFGMKDRTSYSAAKSALIGCTRTWALELATFGITVNAIAPGPIETDLFRKTKIPGSKEEEAVLSTIPMRRMGKPLEVAAAIEFLLSDEAAFITGQTLCIDGGGSL